MIKKVKGSISLQNGEFLDCDIEIDWKPVLPDEEFVAEQTRWLNEIIEKFRIPQQIVLDGSYIPTGPVVDSTLAERDEDEQCKSLMSISDCNK